MMNRRDFLQKSLLSTAVMTLVSQEMNSSLYSAENSENLQFGLCTYLWGRNWDLPTLIANCEKAELGGVELRCEHKHGVGLDTTAQERVEIKKRFKDSSVLLIGFGTNEDFHYQDQAKVKANIERSKAWIKLSADCGGLGVKVKPNNLVKEVDRKITTAQIAKALDEIGRFAADYGQIVRLENHGSCSPIPIMKEIIDQVTAKNVGLCWNCNNVDYEAPGLTANLESVFSRLADTFHVHELEKASYPYEEMIKVLLRRKYKGWLLFECHKDLSDPLPELIDLHKQYKNLIAKCSK